MTGGTVYVITQNALADPTYLDYIRAQYNRSAQQDPPFFQLLLPTELPRLFHGPTAWLKPLDDIFETLGASIERQRRTGTSWFKPDQFQDAGKLAARLRPHEGQDELSKYLFGRLSKETQALVAAQADSQKLRRALAEDLNHILEWPSLYTPERFQGIPLPPLILKAAQTETVDQHDSAPQPPHVGGGLPAGHCQEFGRSLSRHRNPHRLAGGLEGLRKGLRERCLQEAPARPRSSQRAASGQTRRRHQRGRAGPFGLWRGAGGDGDQFLRDQSYV